MITLARWLSTILFRLMGPDIFISYSRRDGAAYAAKLASDLSQEPFNVYIDLRGSPPGSQVPERVLKRARRATMLVLLATPGAQESKAIADELKAFPSIRRTIVGIDFANAASTSDWYPLVSGIAFTQETVENLRAAAPSEGVTSRIRDSFTYVRQAQLLRRSAIAVATVVAVLLGVSVLLGRNVSVALSSLDRTRFADDWAQGVQARDQRKDYLVAAHNFSQASERKVDIASQLSAATAAKFLLRPTRLLLALELPRLKGASLKRLV
jgi:hypothetical protein